MDELALQKYVVDCVNNAGGIAWKMSHRFLVGVPDLLVKLPSNYNTTPSIIRAAGILEVKQRDAPADWSRAGSFALAVTPQQRNFLTRAHKGGMPTGVISFLKTRGQGKKGLYMAIYTLTQMADQNYRAKFTDHRPAGAESQVIEQLVAWHRECVK